MHRPLIIDPYSNNVELNTFDITFEEKWVMIFVKKLPGCALLSVLALVALGSVGSATPLGPGTCAGSTCVPSTYSDFPTAGMFGASIVGDTGVVAFTGKDFTGNTVFTGKFREIVLLDTVTANLDFLYQIQQTGGPDSLGRLTTTDYSATLDDVGICSACSPIGDLISPIGPLHIAPQFVARGVSGSSIVFDFGGTLSTQIGDSNESSVLVIKTNATTFGKGSSSIIDGGIATVASLAPATVPEPSTGILVGLVAVGFFMARRFRLIA